MYVAEVQLWNLRGPKWGRDIFPLVLVCLGFLQQREQWLLSQWQQCSIPSQESLLWFTGIQQVEQGFFRIMPVLDYDEPSRDWVASSPSVKMALKPPKKSNLKNKVPKMSECFVIPTEQCQHTLVRWYCSSICQFASVQTRFPPKRLVSSEETQRLLDLCGRGSFTLCSFRVDIADIASEKAIVQVKMGSENSCCVVGSSLGYHFEPPKYCPMNHRFQESLRNMVVVQNPYDPTNPTLLLL